MSAGTKVILAIVGLLVGVLIIYYGFMLPGPSAAPGATSDEQDDVPAATAGSEMAVVDPVVIQRGPAMPPPLEVAADPNRLLSSAVEQAGDSSNIAPTGSSSLLPRESSPPPVVINTPARDEPASTTPAPATPSPEQVAAPVATIRTDYTIRSGDTLSAIAAQWFGDAQKWDLIVQANPGLDPRRLRIGQRIILPPRDAQREAKPRAGRESQIHVVVSGDTLSGLAQQYYGNGGLWERIFMANRTNLDGDANALRIGMKLVIPPSPY